MRILLIEDNFELGKSIRKKLSKDYVVDWLKDGPNGLFEATINDYCLIILDIGLPSLSGLEICEKLRHRKIFTPIIFLSGYDSTQNKITGLNAVSSTDLTEPILFVF